MDLGFIWAGFDIVWAIEKDVDACATYYFNIVKKIQCMDIKNLNPRTIPDADIIICGPPCQGFSNIGKRDPRDDRNSLYLEMLKIAKVKSPSFVVFENVKGLQSFQNGLILKKLIEGLEQIGYVVDYTTLNARDFGIAQNRERLFIVANKLGVKKFLNCIEKHKTYNESCLRDAIGDLEETATLPNHLLSRNDISKYRMIISKISQGQKLCDTRLSRRSVHTWQIPEFYGSTTDKEKKVLLAIALHRRRKCYRKKESWNDASPLNVHEIALMVDDDFDESVLRSLIDKGYLVEKAPGLYDLKHTFNGKFRRLNYDYPSEAVLTNFGNIRNYVHPICDRAFTVRECGRIQGFPDKFIFRGPINAQYKQAGNAVPPPLAQVLAHEIGCVLLNKTLPVNKLNHTQFVPNAIGEIIRRFEENYKTPDLGNMSDPLDELIYIYISQRTFEKSYIAAFNEVKERYPSFDELRCANIKDLANILDPCGLGKQKAKTISLALSKINKDFCETSLRRLEKFNESSKLTCLLSLPRVGLKTAYCIMMFCFKSKVLPIDANIRRVCQRLDLLPRGIRIEKEYNILHALIHPDYRYSFHVNCICHARKICIPLHPRCAECCINVFCPKKINQNPLKIYKGKPGN